LDPAGVDPTDGVIDGMSPNFSGLRVDNSPIRSHGRCEVGMNVSSESRVRQ
jgi:hypothetical protein